MIHICRYDSERVHAMPLDQERRARYLLRHLELDIIDYPSHSLRERYMHAIISSGDVRLLPSSSSSTTDSAKPKPFSSEVFQGEVDAYQARDHSQHYFANLKVVSSITRVSQLPCSMESMALSRSSLSSVVSGVAVSASERVVSSVSLRVEVAYHNIITIQPWYLAHAEVAAVDNPSDTKPIAPDGMSL